MSNLLKSLLALFCAKVHYDRVAAAAAAAAAAAGGGGAAAAAAAASRRGAAWRCWHQSQQNDDLHRSCHSVI